MNNRNLIGLAIVIILPLFYGFTLRYNEPGKDVTLATGQLMATGEQLYQKNCSACHGVDRQGNPPAFPSLNSIKINKDQVSGLLQTGRNSMPSFSHLSEPERNAITGFLFGEQINVEVITEVTPLKKGETLFIANCASCHKVKPDDSQPPDQKDWGMKPAILGGINAKHSENSFISILNTGPCYMPSFYNMKIDDKKNLYSYLNAKENSSYTVDSTYRSKCKMSCRTRNNK